MTYFVKPASPAQRGERRSSLVGKAEMSDGIHFMNDEVRP
jgi:hypothetical protein